MHFGWMFIAIALRMCAMMSVLVAPAAAPTTGCSSVETPLTARSTTRRRESAAAPSRRSPSNTSMTLPGTVDGAPVFLDNSSLELGGKDMLFFTTRDGRILAYDRFGAQVWAKQFGPGSCKINNGGTTCYTTSSPAIDPNRQYVYTYGLDGYVHKLQVADGVEFIGGGWPQLATTKPYDEKGSSALAIATSGGTSWLYVVHSGYPGDNGDYQGHVTAINLTTGAQNVFNAACSNIAQHLQHLGGGVSPTCSTPQNGIWARAGVIYDAETDRIFLSTGNGAYNGNSGGFNWSESIIALHPDATGGSGANAGKPLDAYTPTNYQSLDNADADIGSTAPAILPVPPESTVPHLAVQGGKDALLRLLNLANLSGQGGPGHVGGEIGPIINVPQGGGVFSQPAVWINPADSSTWVFVVNGNGASALRRHAQRQRRSDAGPAMAELALRDVTDRCQRRSVLHRRQLAARAQPAHRSDAVERCTRRRHALAEPHHRQQRALRHRRLEQSGRVRADHGAAHPSHDDDHDDAGFLHESRAHWRAAHADGNGQRQHADRHGRISRRRRAGSGLFHSRALQRGSNLQRLHAARRVAQAGARPTAATTPMQGPRAQCSCNPWTPAPNSSPAQSTRAARMPASNHAEVQRNLSTTGPARAAMCVLTGVWSPLEA